MTLGQRRFWLWVNVVCVAVALVCILCGLELTSRPVLQGTLVAIGVTFFVFGVASAVIVALRVRRERRRR